MILYADFRLKLEIQGVQLNFLNEIIKILIAEGTKENAQVSLPLDL